MSGVEWPDLDGAAEARKIAGEAALDRAEIRSLRNALTKLSNEVLGSLPLMEPLARREFGNTNYAVLIQRAEEARMVLGATVYQDQMLYTDGFKDGYAQAIGDADLAIRKRGDDLPTRLCRHDVLALVNVPYDPREVMPQPDWSKYSVKEPAPYTPPVTAPVPFERCPRCQHSRAMVTQCDIEGKCLRKADNT